MLKRGAAACSERVVCNGTSRIVSVGPPAKADAGAASATAEMATRSFIRGPQGAMPPSPPGLEDPPRYNWRTVRALLAALGLTLVLAAGAGASTSGKRVLAIRFGPDLEVNPVTQDYLT